MRIIRACREMHIRTVAVYADCDSESLHVKLADEAVCIGNHRLENSYLNENAILQAAVNSGAQAIHPGFGFLSERASFSRACASSHLTFIGPSADVIELMGNKSNARAAMVKAGVPVVPGSSGLLYSVEEAQKIAAEIGYPVLIKAAAGGGGKGMRVCYKEDGLKEAYEQARLEAKNAFNNDDMYMEKFIENPRHIEIQIMGDCLGNVLHFFERECSAQRNNQKMIEEAPVENISPATKKRLYDVSVAAAKNIRYVGAGTMEFIMDRQENFYFIEMNTRIQVEHPVTEAITGTDLIKMQIHVAENQPLPFKQRQLQIYGHAIELRVNAEDPAHDFIPMPGRVTSLHFPGGNGIRVDSYIYPGYNILPFYDSMLAKIIVHGNTREEAMEKAIRCMEEIDVEGTVTNIDFLLDILLSQEFRENKYTTSLISDLIRKQQDLSSERMDAVYV